MANPEAGRTPSDLVLSLVTTAAVAAGPAPADPVGRAGWLDSVGDLATALYRRAGELEAVLSAYAKCKEIRGVIVTAEEASKRGHITFRPSTPSDLTPADGLEHLRTPFLSDPRAAALLAQARSLAGTGIECRFGKWSETMDSGPMKGKTRAMVEWLEPLERPPAESRQSAPESRQSAPESRPAAHRQEQQPAPEPRQSAPESRPPARPQPARAPQGIPADLDMIRNLRINTRRGLMAAAQQYLGLGDEAVELVETEECGPRGAQTATEMLRVWNAVIDRALQPA